MRIYLFPHEHFSLAERRLCFEADAGEKPKPVDPKEKEKKAEELKEGEKDPDKAADVGARAEQVKADEVYKSMDPKEQKYVDWLVAHIKGEKPGAVDPKAVKAIVDGMDDKEKAVVTKLEGMYKEKKDSANKEEMVKARAGLKEAVDAYNKLATKEEKEAAYDDLRATILMQGFNAPKAPPVPEKVNLDALVQPTSQGGVAMNVLGGYLLKAVTFLKELGLIEDKGKKPGGKPGESGELPKNPLDRYNRHPKRIADLKLVDAKREGAGKDENCKNLEMNPRTPLPKEVGVDEKAVPGMLETAVKNAGVAKGGPKGYEVGAGGKVTVKDIQPDTLDKIANELLKLAGPEAGEAPPSGPGAGPKWKENYKPAEGWRGSQEGR